MVSLDYQINASAYDARNQGSVWPGDGNFNSGYVTLVLGASTTAFEIIGVCFRAIAIPPNATITAAYLSWYLVTNLGNPTLSVACEDADNPGAFVTTSHEPYDSYLARTSAVLGWSPTVSAVGWFGGKGQTNELDVASLIQEVVNRPGWASGNNIAFVVWFTNTTLPATDSRKSVRAYDGSTTYAPKLHIEFEYATGCPRQAMHMRRLM